MDEYSATDHSVILTQQGEEGEKMQKQTVQLQKKHAQSFHENISRGLIFMRNDSGPPLLSYRDMEGRKTPETHF